MTSTTFACNLDKCNRPSALLTVETSYKITLHTQTRQHKLLSFGWARRFHAIHTSVHTRQVSDSRPPQGFVQIWTNSSTACHARRPWLRLWPRWHHAWRRLPWRGQPPWKPTARTCTSTGRNPVLLDLNRRPPVQHHLTIGAMRKWWPGALHASVPTCRTPLSVRLDHVDDGMP